MIQTTSAGSTGAHRVRRRRVLRRRSVLLVGAMAALLVGAGAGSALVATSEPVAPLASVAGIPAVGERAAPAGLNLASAPSPLGTLVTNDGFTVYRFDRDTARPSASHCTGACAQAWPPVLASDVPWLKGLPSDKVGTVDRPEGTKQLTLGGWPIYRYAQDTAPGDTKGQGVGGTWCAIGPDGKPAVGGTGTSAGRSTAPAAPASPAPATGDRYGSAGAGSSGSGAASPSPGGNAGSGY